MNRNQKIAIGCGAAGCLGLVLVCLVGGVAYFALRSSTSNSNRSRINLNRNSTVGSDTSSNDSETANTATADESVSSSLSDDDKHKLFQAAHVTQDMSLIQRVWRKLGLTNADGTPNEQYTQFLKDHVTWLFSNTEFGQEVNTPEKARAYVEAHLND